MRKAVLGKVRKYRWELWLFFGVGVVASIAGTLVQIPVTFFIALNYVWYSLLFYITYFALLGISYKWVRSLQRPMLKLVWQYSLVAAVVGIGFSFALAGAYDYVTRDSYSWYVLLLALAGLVQSVIRAWFLVWFARRASRGGFDKALVLIGISAFPSTNIIGVVQYSLLLSIDDRISPLVVGLATTVLTLVAVWALKRVDMRRGFRTKGDCSAVRGSMGNIDCRVCSEY